MLRARGSLKTNQAPRMKKIEVGGEWWREGESATRTSVMAVFIFSRFLLFLLELLVASSNLQCEAGTPPPPCCVSGVGIV